MPIEAINWREFVEDGNGRGSAARLNMIVGVIVGSIICLLLAFRGDLGWEIFGIYIAGTGGVYGVGKWNDTKTEIAQINANSTNQPVVLPPQPNTVIQVNPGGNPNADPRNIAG